MGVELKVWTEGNILTASAELRKISGCQCLRDALRISIEHPVIAYLKKLEGVLSPCSPFRISVLKRAICGKCSPPRTNEQTQPETKTNNDDYEGNPAVYIDTNSQRICTSIQVIVPKLDPTSKFSREFNELITAAEEGLKVYPPELCEEGVNGTYFLKDKNGKKVAVFKPEDEQGDTELNPKSPKDKSTRKYSDLENEPAVPEHDERNEQNDSSDGNNISKKGLVKGEVTLREVSASLLDKEGFYGVPITSSVQIIHPSFQKPKVGSLQAYVENNGASWDLGCNVYPVKEVHKIGVLDLHIFNTDRHEGNILIKVSHEFADPSTYHLIPIDHGYSLPHSLNAAWFDWLTWPQAKQPFDAETLEFIERLNPESDASLLEELNIRKECIRTMKISTTLLKKGAKRGLSLFEIGDMVCRRDVSKPSDLEIMYEKAYQLVEFTEEMEDKDQMFLTILFKIMDEEVEKRALKRQRFNTV